MKVKSVAPSCPTPCDPMDCSPPGSSVHGLLQARILERVAMPSSSGSSWSRNQIWVSYVFCISRQVLYHWRLLGSLYILVHPICVPGIAFLLYLSWNLIMPSQILNVTTSKRSSLFTLDFFPNTHLISYIPDQTIWDWSFYRSRVVICWQFLMKQTKPEFSALYKVSICLINICLKWVSEHFNENKQYSP